MKKFLMLFLIIGVLFATQTTYAISFEDTIDWKTNTGSYGTTYDEIIDSITYTHTLEELNSSLYILTNATLSLRQYGNRNNNICELWFSKSANDLFIGTLSTSSTYDPNTSKWINKWVIDKWDLDENILAEMTKPDPWSLTIKLVETTEGPDKIRLDYSTLSGNYVPQVPEPSTMLLLGSILIGFTITPKKRIRIKK